jgi:hypothetical protein
MSRPKLYDGKCLELAEHFMQGESLEQAANERACKALAEEIQDAVESWFEMNQPLETMFSHDIDCPICKKPISSRDYPHHIDRHAFD